MVTLMLWITICDSFCLYTTAFEKIFSYALGTFFSIITIPLDILTSPFQLIGIIIFLITNRKGK